MKLQSVTEMGQVDGLCCRQSPLRGAIGAVIFTAILTGGVFAAWYAGARWFLWGGGAVLVALFVPVAIRDVVAKFRPTNWVLWADFDGLWINLRSYARPAAGAATVVRLKYEEIDHAHRHSDTWTGPSQNGSVQWKLECLDLHLVGHDTRGLARALAEQRDSGQGAYPPVTLAGPGVIRVAWRGHGLGHDVAPALDKVLAEISPRVTVTDATRTDRPDWMNLNDAELDEQVEHLVRWSDQPAAVELLVRRRRCSRTDAYKLVTDLATKT